MNGRLENNIKNEKLIKNRLVNAPKIVKDYSFNFSNKTTLTKKNYIYSVIDFLEYLKSLGLDINNNNIFNEIKTSDINRYMEYIHYKDDGVTENSPSFRATKLFAISNFFEFLIDEDISNRNPCKRVSIPKDLEDKKIIAMDSDEIQHLRNNIINGCGTERAKKIQKKWYKRDLAILALGCRNGLRVTSISEINVDDIDFENKTVRVVEKGNKPRVCHLGDNTIDIILEWMDDRESILNKDKSDVKALFISNYKKRITSEGIRKLLKKYTYDMDKHITPHKMRSSCATNLYDITGDIYLVQEVLGHKNISNTKRYAKVSEKKLEQAANILDVL